MWMFGVTVWEVYSRGEEPWAGLNGGQILRKVEAGDRLEKPLACPPSVYSLITEVSCQDQNTVSRYIFRVYVQQNLLAHLDESNREIGK